MNKQKYVYNLNSAQTFWKSLCRAIKSFETAVCKARWNPYKEDTIGLFYRDFAENIVFKKFWLKYTLKTAAFDYFIS